uniref:Uncharacterized protein n=1 Tax=Arundo donax TaxID=35708 RepID=A0A0A8Z5G3_ARUDO
MLHNLWNIEVRNSFIHRIYLTEHNRLQVWLPSCTVASLTVQT